MLTTCFHVEQFLGFRETDDVYITIMFTARSLHENSRVRYGERSQGVLSARMNCLSVGTVADYLNVERIWLSQLLAAATQAVKRLLLNLCQIDFESRSYPLFLRLQTLFDLQNLSLPDMILQATST